MFKRIIITSLLCSNFLFAIDIATVLANQKQAHFPDTAEIKMRTTMTMQSMPAQVMESRIITKGKDKSITEVKSPLMNMKIIKNGDKVSVTDLKTGQTIPSPMAGRADNNPAEQDLGKPEDYEKPVKEGSLWLIKNKDNTKPTLLYSESEKRVVKMRQDVQGGFQTETTLIYCKSNCSFPGTPSKIDIQTKNDGTVVINVSLEMLSVQKLNNIPDNAFKVE